MKYRASQDAALRQYHSQLLSQIEAKSALKCLEAASLGWNNVQQRMENKLRTSELQQHTSILRILSALWHTEYFSPH